MTATGGSRTASVRAFATTSPLVRKFLRWDDLGPDEQDALEALSLPTRVYHAGAEIVAQGSRPNECCLLLEGFAARATLLSNGSRQIGAIHIAGDLIDIQSFVLKVMDHQIIALSNCRVAVIRHAIIGQLAERFPHLARLFWLNTAIDAAISREWLAALGRRNAEGHMAHLICELYLRLQDVGLAHDLSCGLPITQAVLADALGLTAVHVNRTLQTLRKEGLIVWEGGTVTIPNWDRLVRTADFDDTYLSRTREPR